jgi:hypothetical protein
MQRCPKCGYRDRFDWPAALWAISCGILYLTLLFTEVDVLKISRMWVFVIGFFGFLLFFAGTMWRAYRSRMEDAQYSRSQELQRLD